MRMSVNSLAAAVLAAAALPSLAQTPGPAKPPSANMLSPDDVKSQLVGKTLTFRRNSDGVQVAWQFKPSGYLIGNNTRGGTDTGSWSFDERGGLCLKWRGPSNEGCYFFFRGKETAAGLVMRATPRPKKDSKQPYEIISIQ
jgi:hypothetical protein